jgi:hypothetical protein
MNVNTAATYLSLFLTSNHRFEPHGHHERQGFDDRQRSHPWLTNRLCNTGNQPRGCADRLIRRCYAPCISC